MAKSVEKKTQGARELRDQPVGLRLRKSLKDALDELAEEDRRPLASLIEIILEEYVATRRKAPKKK